MAPILVFLALLGTIAAQQQYGDPKTAAILNEQRYLSGDGSFGAQYTQEDGVQFKEESLPDGSRRGSYSYIDPTGQKKTVSYTAGKNGFQPTGDHLPQAPPQVLPVAPRPQYTPLPQYNSPVEPQYRPEPQYQPQAQPQQQYQPQQFQPQQFQAQPQYQPQPQYRPEPQYQPQYRPQPQPQPQPQYQPQYQATTPAPHRFFPPGKLSLNRSPDGFSYSFNKS